MLTGDWKGPSWRPSWGAHDHQVEIKHMNIWPKWTHSVSFNCPKVRKKAGSSWSVSWRTTASSSRTETSTSTSRCSSLGRRMSRRRRSTTSSFTSLSRCPSWMLPLCSVNPPTHSARWRTRISWALPWSFQRCWLVERTCRRCPQAWNLSSIKRNHRSKREALFMENMGMTSQCYLLSPLKSYSLLIANLSFVLWNILHFFSIYILIFAVRPVSQQVNINVLKVICEQTSPDTSGEVCWPTLSRWCALCTRLALIIALPLPIVQCLAGICPLWASISVRGGPSHSLSKTNRTNWVQSSINWQLP